MTTLLAVESEKRLSNFSESQRTTIVCLEKQLVKYRRILAVARNRRNRMIPKISTLPTEILIEIIMQVQFLYNSYKWLTLAHVCRHWRDIILSCPRLFSRVELPVHDLAHLREFVRLSGSIPLTVVWSQALTQTHPWVHYSWNAIVPHLSRTQGLQIGGTPKCLLDHPWPQSCPSVTCLEWWNSNYDEKVPEDVSRSVLESMPNLHTLRGDTDSIGFTWIGAPFSSVLRELRIGHNPRNNGDASLQQLAAALSQLTSLTTLYLEDLYHDTYRVSGSSDILQSPLPHLQYLRLIGDPLGLAVISKLPLKATRVEAKLTQSLYYRGINDALVSLPSILMTINRKKQLHTSTAPHHTISIRLTHNGILTSYSIDINGWVSPTMAADGLPSFRLLFNAYQSKRHDMFGPFIARILPSIQDTRVLSLRADWPWKLKATHYLDADG